jgi:large subunit ribosomal protein L1
MAHPRSLIAPLSRITAPSIAIVRPDVPRLTSLSYQTIRCAATKTDNKKKGKKQRNTFKQYDLKHAEQFSLVDAMQYASTQTSSQCYN